MHSPVVSEPQLEGLLHDSVLLDVFTKSTKHVDKLQLSTLEKKTCKTCGHDVLKSIFVAVLDANVLLRVGEGFFEQVSDNYKPRKKNIMCML